YRACDGGESTYLFKDLLSRDLIRVIREVHAGEKPLSPEFAASLSERATRPHLTRREIQVLERISQGLRNKEVGAALGIGDETVQAHVRSIFFKLGVNDRTAAVNVAVRRGIIHLE